MVLPRKCDGEPDRHLGEMKCKLAMISFSPAQTLNTFNQIVRRAIRGVLIKACLGSEGCVYTGGWLGVCGGGEEVGISDRDDTADFITGYTSSPQAFLLPVVLPWRHIQKRTSHSSPGSHK